MNQNADRKPQTERLFSDTITPEQWFQHHQKAIDDYVGARDTRLPSYIVELPKHVCAIRHSIERLRVIFRNREKRLQKFFENLERAQVGLLSPENSGQTLVLLRNALSRHDWRERDILEMILEFLAASESRCPETLNRERLGLEHLQAKDNDSYERAIQGLISEARGNLLGLIHVHCKLSESVQSLSKLDRDALNHLVTVLGESMGIVQKLPDMDEFPGDDPAATWRALFDRANHILADAGIRLPLKDYEKASLYLLESLLVKDAPRAAFVRYLIENEDAYRRLLASCYADANVQRQRFHDEVERYNRLPENQSLQAAYDDSEASAFLHAFFIRPDVVDAIVEREQQKSLYKVIAGLGPRAYLPRVLHEVQNIFGYILPEAAENIVKGLQLDPVDIIRVIASYKQYSADQRGDILIYICKGTACFLRGQPELSRRLVAEIQAEEGAVGRHGIQFIEMDCFGVCHLAPVIKTENEFLGRRTSEDIPHLIKQLLKGPSYDNRLTFLKRILERLAPGRTGYLPKTFEVMDLLPADPLSSSRLPVPTEKLKESFLEIDASGLVFVALDGNRFQLGNLVPNTMAFRYQTPKGKEQIGCLLLDDLGQVQRVLHIPEHWLAADLKKTMKPQAYVADGWVWLQRVDEAVRLGPYTDQVLILENQDRYWLLIVDHSVGGAPPGQEAAVEEIATRTEKRDFIDRQDRLVLGFAAEDHSTRIDSYMAQGGYESVFRVLGLRGEAAWEPAEIIMEISKGRLRGRGGAGFPTGTKWEAMRLAKCIVDDKDENQDEIKLIVANGDEGDPGAFMDRTLIQERPHQLIEGMVLAAIAVGARYGVIYVRKEYEDAVRSLENALFQARRKGFLGNNIFGVDGLHFDLEIRLGAGAFVAGEKRAIMRAIEGKPAEPTLNAVSNTRRGLWGKPTLLNNVETFANVPLIIQNGGSWYARQGTAGSGGSKIFSVAGIVNQTGLVEVRFGRTLSDIIRICGGIQEGKVLAGVQIGGPSGAILSLTGVRSYLLHIPLDFDTFNQAGAMLGSGGLVFIGEDDDVVRLARHFTDWLADESCGQCPACLRGTVSLGKTLDSILLGEGNSGHIHALWAKSDAIKSGSQCGLGMTAANPVTSALRFFPHAFFHAILGNPRLDPMECFKTLEALRLLTREDIVQIRGRHREVIGYSFTLKKHLFRYLVGELERLDKYRPQHQHRTQQFLDLLQIPAHEVGLRDITIEASLEEATQRAIEG